MVTIPGYSSAPTRTKDAHECLPPVGMAKALHCCQVHTFMFLRTHRFTHSVYVQICMYLECNLVNIHICYREDQRETRSICPLGATWATLGSLTVPCIILSHLHFLHTVSWEPASTALHGSLPETALPNAEHWGKKPDRLSGQSRAGGHPRPCT